MPGKDNMFAEKRYTDMFGSDLSLLSVGRRKGALNHAYSSTSNYQHILVYVEKGDTVLYVNNRPHYIHPGMLYVLFREADNHYDASHTVWSIHWIGIDGTEAIPLFQNLGLSPDSPTLELINAPAVFDCYQRLFALTDEEGYGAKFSLKAEFYSLIGLLLHNRDLSGRYARDYVKEVNALIERHFRDCIRVEEIAQTLHVDRCHLARIYHLETGITVKEKIRETQLKEAKRLLAAGYSVKDTALSCGFRDPLYFSKVYSACFGTPPSQASAAKNTSLQEKSAVCNTY